MDDSGSETYSPENAESTHPTSDDINTAHIIASSLDSNFLKVPNAVKALRKELLGEYTVPDSPPHNTHIDTQSLSQSDILSLQHYVAWRKSNGTIQAYKLHATVLEKATRTKIFSLNQVKKLAQALTKFTPQKIDMCPRSCIAYTGKYKGLDKCPYFHPKAKVYCYEKRYHTTSRGHLKPRAQFQVLPIMSTIRAMFANADTAKLLRHRDSCLQEVLQLVGTAAMRKYSDYGDSQVHLIQHQHLGLFKDSRDIGFALSTDGAQLTMKKQSNTWLMILIILNLPPSIRYKTNNIIINFATPGPNAPGDIESFIWPLFEEMAMASEGIWMWDAVDSSYFVHRACISMALGDMLGSAKLNGMAGHSAIFGDRFSLVQGAKSSQEKGAKAQYYPSTPPGNATYNPDRPEKYNLLELPMRSQEDYWNTIELLDKAATKKAKTHITRTTGVSRLPLCAASVAFIHPTFFPLDPFHLFYENNMAFIWDIWTVNSSPSEPVHLPKSKAESFGQLIPLAMCTLPPKFCGPVRNPYLKRQSQYKVYEWMALLHWYIIPMGIELGFNPEVLSNFSLFAKAIEIAMTIAPRDTQQIRELQLLIVEFLEDYQKLYIGNNPENIMRARLCVFQLIHIPYHIQWNGSVRLGSQATVERSIGEVGHKIRSRKAPFANLANIIFQKELVKILCLYYPAVDLINNISNLDNPSDIENFSEAEVAIDSDIDQYEDNLIGSRFLQKHYIKKNDLSTDSNLSQDLAAICSFLNIDYSNFSNNLIPLKCWGKLKLASKHTLGSQLNTRKGKVSRRSEWFEVIFQFGY